MTTTNSLQFHNTCRCAGTGCGGHVTTAAAKWQGLVPVSTQAVP
jgi:hypothetical protein